MVAYVALGCWTALVSLEDSGWPSFTPIAVKPAVVHAQSQPKALRHDPCGLAVVECAGKTTKRVIKATVTTYQAVAGQTDASPCSGAMRGVNFCKPPFPIVANNCLKFGTKVILRGETFTVADRMSSRYGCDHFDVLTSGENFRLINEPITVL